MPCQFLLSTSRDRRAPGGSRSGSLGRPLNPFCQRRSSGGANRNFDPLESFPSGFKSEIINTGGEIITFDSAVSAQNVGPGQRGVFLFNNSVWY